MCSSCSSRLNVNPRSRSIKQVNQKFSKDDAVIFVAILLLVASWSDIYAIFGALIMAVNSQHKRRFAQMFNFLKEFTEQLK